MKLKEKWANDANPYNDVHDYEEHGTWPSAWIAGFEFARNYIVEHGGHELVTSRQISELGESEAGK
jgi:hypothetical protein